MQAKKITLFLTSFFFGWLLSIVAFCTLLNLTVASGQYNKATREAGYNHQLKFSDFVTLDAKFFFSSPKLDTMQLMMMGMIAGSLLAIKVNDSYMKGIQNKNLKGSARWAKNKELKKELTAIDENNLHKADQTGIPIAKRGSTLYVDTSTTHSLIIGTTRSGKTQTYVLPMIRILCAGKDKHSMVVNDPKGEILENTYSLLQDAGYKIYVLNLRDTNYSDEWNPLSFIIREYVHARESGNNDMSKINDYIEAMALTLTDNPHTDPIWPSSAKSLLVAMILYLLEKGYENNCLDKLNMYSVYTFFLEYGQDEMVVENGVAVSVNKLDKLFKALPVGSAAKAAYATSKFASGEMRSSIFATLSDNIGLFGRDDGIVNLTSGDTINLNALTDEQPCAIFMVIPDDRPTRHVIASLFIAQCYTSLVEQMYHYQMSKLPRRVDFILDEFSNMVKIPNMDNKITVSAGRNILFHLFVQDLNQLDAKYDKVSKTIRSNCGNLIYIYSLDKDTNEYFSALLGNQTKEYKTYSGKLSDGLNNASQQFDGKPLKDATELSVLQYGDTIVKRQRMYPIQSKFGFFYKLNIEPTPISDIPLSSTSKDVSKYLFPFAIIDKLYNQAIGKAPVMPENPQFKSAFRTNLPAEHARSSAPASFYAPPEEEHTIPVHHSPEGRHDDALSIALKAIDNISNGQFSIELDANNIGECKAMLRRYEINRRLPPQTASILRDYLDNL